MSVHAAVYHLGDPDFRRSKVQRRDAERADAGDAEPARHPDRSPSPRTSRLWFTATRPICSCSRTSRRNERRSPDGNDERGGNRIPGS
jgi:hypothetical protein